MTLAPPEIRKDARLYVPDDLGEGMLLALGPDQSHYLQNVLRLKVGDTVRLFNANNGEWRGVISALKKRVVEITIHEQRRQPQTETGLWLCCAPIKRAHFDFMVMKATELGVTRLQPILTSRTQVREVNIERCSAIAIEAAEQSERLSIPEILAPVTLEKLIKAWPPDCLPILCAEFGEALPVSEAFLQYKNKKAKQAAILTGPEGGFSPIEMQQLQLLPHVLPIRLGPRILRADTAALAALSCWQALCGDWR
jgi:16S rRNA (uracil1498-N3)-methyltransferase